MAGEGIRVDACRLAVHRCWVRSDAASPIELHYTGPCPQSSVLLARCHGLQGKQSLRKRWGLCGIGSAYRGCVAAQLLGISRQDRPSWRRDSILARETNTLGRPSRLPLLRAVVKPARMRSEILIRSCLATGGDDGDHGVPEDSAGVEALLGMAAIADAVGCQPLKMLQRWQNTFPAEPVERPEQQYVELALGCGGKHRLKLLTVGNLAGFVIDVLGDNCPAAVSGKFPQLAQLVLNFLALVLSGDSAVQRNALGNFGCRLRVRSEG